MSLDSWKAEFYPTPADKVPEDEAIQHSLRKWIGLRQENLDKHGLEKYGVQIICSKSLHSFDMTGDTCSLCQLYFNNKAEEPCVTCPLYNLDEDENCSNEYGIWMDDDDPEPMIAALRKALREAPDIHVKGFDIIYEPDWQACDLCGAKSPLIQKCCNCPNNVCTFCQSVSEHCNTCLDGTDIKTHYSIDVGY